MMILHRCDMIKFGSKEVFVQLNSIHLATSDGFQLGALLTFHHGKTLSSSVL